MKTDEFGRFVKPERGAYRLEQKAKRAEVEKHERHEMEAAKARDHHKCRVPRCEFKGLAIEAAHLRSQHRGMGGNPSGDRTERKTIISLCIRHHDWYDGFDLDIEPLNADKLFDDACAFYLRGQHIATEKLIGVSSVRMVK